MLLITSRQPFSIQNPYRSERPTTNKIIFLSFEGSVTEEEYFERVSDIFSEIKTKIQFISVAEDAVHTHHKFRTHEQNCLLSKTRPKQLVERINKFIQEKDSIYEFSKYPDDEFWIVTDIDNNLSQQWIKEWKDTLTECETKKYGYAVSNPFFEIWLLLHHDDPTDEDKSYAVTVQHEYEPTSHFRKRLSDVNASLKDKKHISANHYDTNNILKAVERARLLHKNCDDKCPMYFATTVYMLLEKMIGMLPDFEINTKSNI